MRTYLAQVFFLVIYFVVSNNKHSFGQTNQLLIDSLLLQLRIAKTDTHKINLLNSISYHYNNILPDSGIKYGLQALAQSELLHYQTGKSNALYYLGHNYLSKGDDATGLDYYFKNLQLNEELNDKKRIATILDAIGTVYFWQSNYPKALDFYFRAYAINEKTGNKRDLHKSISNIGNVFLQQQQLSKSLQYYFSALKIAEEMNDQSAKAVSLSNIGTAYGNEERFDKALEYFLKAIAIEETRDNKRGLATNMLNAGLCYLRLNRYKDALAYYEQSIKVAREASYTRLYARYAQHMGVMYLQLAGDAIHSKVLPGTKGTHLQQAVIYLNQALKAYIQFGSLTEIKETYAELSKVYKLKGEFKNALEAHENYVLYKDSVFSKENTKKIAMLELQSQYEKERLTDSIKNAEAHKLVAAKLQNQRGLMFFGGSIAVLILAFSIIILRKNKKLSLQQLRNKISRDLHDEVGSTLTSIALVNEMSARSFTENTKHAIAERIQKAQNSMNEIIWMLTTKNDSFDNVVVRLGEIAREILEPKEINYLLKTPEQADSFKISMEKKRELLLIYKECLNNIAKYSGCDNVEIELKILKKNVTLTVTDNGKGFDKALSYSGNGLYNMKERAARLRGMININSARGNGTSVALAFPVR